jgi:hypothetical protein
MIGRLDIFGSVEDVWILWLASVAGLALLTCRMLKRLRLRDLRRLARSEHGVSYTLTYVMVFPLYVFLVCLVVEATLILVVKMGTVYGAYAAARSRIVWQPANPSVADKKMHAAAVHAMTPFASSNPQHFKKIGATDQSANGARDYALAYNKYANKSRDPDYLIAKFSYAHKATHVHATPAAPNQPNSPITVKLTYRMPLHVPGVTRFLANNAQDDFPTRAITSSATIPNEAPDNPTRKLGIEYAPK